MTPLDEAPEQRWRRTVDRRSRPAKLKVERLLRDFGYAELDAEVGDAIEARLAGVALGVSPPLREASTSQVVTIYADEGAIERLPPPAEQAPAVDPAPASAPPPPPALPRPRPRASGPAPEPSVATDVAQMVTYLKQEVLDARAESERLRTELDQRIAARTDAEVEAQAVIAEQAAALEERDRQISELGTALEQSRQALAETREEIRRAVGELQALPEPELFPESVAGDDDGDLEDELDLGGEDQYSDPVARDEDEWTATAIGEAAPAASTPEHAPELGDSLAGVEAAAPEGEPLALADPVRDVGEPALGVGEAAADFEDPSPRPAEPALEPDESAKEFDAPALDLDEPPLGGGEPASVAEPDLDLQPPAPEGPGEPDSWVPAQLRESDPGPDPSRGLEEIDSPPLQEPEPTADREAPPTAEQFPPASAEDDGPPINDDVVADFDAFLYDPDELYDPPVQAAGDEPLDVAWLDQPMTALPPPSPPPPSPWADEPEPEAPATHDRPMLGKVRRRGGRSRGRWQGSCSVCGREPAESKRKDLEAAGWDLDNEAAACPQCRGVG